MKKISVFALMTAMLFPAFAQETVAPETTENVAAQAPVVADAATENALESESVPVQEVATVAKQESSEKSGNAFPRGLQFGLGVSGTSGLNAFVGYANKNFDSFWAKRFGVRFDFGTTAPVKSKLNDLINDIAGDEVEIGDNLTVSDFALKGKHYAAMLDFYPFGNTWLLGGWRLTGGYYMGELHADALIAGTIDELDAGYHEFELMDTQFRYLGNTVNGTAEFDWDYRGPYLGTGFDFGLFAGFKIYLDAGVVFTNKVAQLSLDVPFENLEINQGDGWKNVINEDLQSVVDEVKAETLADAQSELNDLKFYPMVKLGFMYRF